MKVGILIDRFNVGGVEKIALEQVSALQDIGVEVDLLVLTKKPVVEDAFLDLRDKVSIVYLDQRLPRFLRSSFKFPVFNFFSFFHISYPFLLPFIVKRKEYSYVICHGTFTCFSAISLKYFSSIPYSAYIWDPIGYILEKVYKNSFNSVIFRILLSLAEMLDSLILRTADEVLVGGKAHNEYFKKVLANVKITVVAPSVHPIRRMNIKNRSGILLVTAWKKGKYPEYIFEILKNIPTASIKLVGRWLDDDYRYEFEQNVRRNKYTKNIEIVGAVSEKELSEHYSKAEVFLQINDDRGFGMPALESAAHGTPFVIPKDQGVCELFQSGIHGFYTVEKNTTEITKCLKILLNTKAKSQKMGKACYEIVKNNYSWQVHARDLMSVINRYS